MAAAAVPPQELMKVRIDSLLFLSAFAASKMKGLTGWIVVAAEVPDPIGRKVKWVRQFCSLPLKRLRPDATSTRAFSAIWLQALLAMLPIYSSASTVRL